MGYESHAVRHASPWDETTYIYPDSEKLSEIQLHRNELLLLGHTHYPMSVQCGEGFVLNPGSVGQPRDRDPDLLTDYGHSDRGCFPPPECL